MSGETAKTVEEAVASIPYYNERRGRTKTINFVWAPSVEDFRHVWSVAEAYGGSHPWSDRHQAMFDTDVLGLRAGGAARIKAFFDQPDVGWRHEDEDDED